MTTYAPLSASPGTYVWTGSDASAVYSASASTSMNWLEALTPAAGVTVVGGVGVSITQTPTWYAGAAISDVVRLHAADVENLSYGVMLTDAAKLFEVASMAIPITLTAGVGIAQQLTVLQGVMVIDKLFLQHDQTALASYGVVLTQALRVNDTLSQFMSGVVSDVVRMHSTLLVDFRAIAQAGDTVGVQDLLQNKLVMSAFCAEDIQLSATELLQMIFNGTVHEGIQLSAMHVSPSGSVTTWAINTRTGATTEYTNYDFNSFASMGHKYLGASSDGLFELNGSRDDGSNIVARMKSGLMQLAGSKFTMFKNAYLGMKVEDGATDFLLKMTTGDGREYIYKFHPQDMLTTRVNFGKGLRARYWSWELITPGPDWDLDSIEFIPITTQRRV